MRIGLSQFMFALKNAASGAIEACKKISQCDENSSEKEDLNF